MNTRARTHTHTYTHTQIRTDRACQKDRLEELHDHPAATLWATLPYSFAELRHSSIILDSCMTGSLGLCVRV